MTDIASDGAHLEPLAAAFGELASGYRSSCVLFAALATKLFATIARNGATPSQAGEAAGLPVTSTRLLLDALAALRLIERHSGRYKLRGDLHPILDGGRNDFIEELLLHRRENAVWLRASAILQGQEQAPQAYRRELLDSRVAAFPGIQAMNRLLAHDIVDRIGDILDGARRVLDIGGGDGCMCGIILARNPAIAVRVLDLELGMALCARHTDFLRAGRLQLEVGDARTCSPVGDHDLVVVNELLELFPRAEKLEILRRAVAALTPGGHIIVIKFTLASDGASPPAAALFSVRMRLKTDAGYLETDDEVVSMLADCGCEHIRVEDVRGFKSIIRGTWPNGSAKAERWDSGAREQRAREETATVTSDSQPSAEQLALWRELVSVATSFRPAAVLFAAVDLDIFSLIPPSGCSAEELAAACGVAEVGIRVLLNALAAIGILQRGGVRYTMHPDIRALLARGPHCILPEIMQYRRENEIWLRLAEGLRDPRTRPDADMDGSHLPEYLAAVELTNRQSAERLIERIAPLIGRARQVLDLGGGSGTYAIRLLDASRNLKVTLLDRPEVIEECRRRLKDRTDGGRLDLVAGNASDFDLPPHFDVVIISDLLHYFCPDGKRRILHNARRALAPGGAIVVSKFTLDGSGTSPPAAALFSLKVHLQRSEAYLETDDEAADMMRGLGLQHVEVELLDSVKSVVIGRLEG